MRYFQKGGPKATASLASPNIHYWVRASKFFKGRGIHHEISDKNFQISMKRENNEKRGILLYVKAIGVSNRNRSHKV